jgi:hypothetical protein
LGGIGVWAQTWLKERSSRNATINLKPKETGALEMK